MGAVHQPGAAVSGFEAGMNPHAISRGDYAKLLLYALTTMPEDERLAIVRRSPEAGLRTPWVLRTLFVTLASPTWTAT